MSQLAEIKHDGGNSSNVNDIVNDIKPWDRDYLLAKLQLRMQSEVSAGNVKDYFSVGTVIAGLNELFTRLYDISFVPVAALKGETWDSHQVRKIKVVDNAANKTLGFLYLDFWSTKVLPSHFTIVCLRRLNTSIGSETIESMENLVQLDDDYQLPVVSLVCNLPVQATFCLEDLLVLKMKSQHY